MGKGAAKYRIIILLLFFVSSISSAQNSENNYVNSELDPERIPISLMTKTLPPPNDPLETDINYGLLWGVGGVTLGIGVGVHIYQANAWWQEQGSEFKIENDWKYALWIDKVGHFYGTVLMAHGLSSGFEAANIDLERSAIYGAIGAFAFETFIEIQDGFGPQWGFSPGDLAFDFLGALYSVGQYYYPTLKHIQPRVSYYPSERYRSGEHKGNVIDDYEGQKYWMALRMKELLPDKMSQYWPSFLMISVGMGIRDWDGFGGGKQDFFIALDFDAETIPLYGPFWQFVKNTLNFIHFPMPGIRITPDAAAFVIVY
ncbi:MAG: DUF2279 domain-containing protein [Melioribacteraceae bacterium]|nr:DUF2279 domain-containing protein [Melioribacteraceae bacterium]